MLFWMQTSWKRDHNRLLKDHPKYTKNPNKSDNPPKKNSFLMNWNKQMAHERVFNLLMYENELNCMQFGMVMTEMLIIQ